jgi:putative sterol carrier protein
MADFPESPISPAEFFERFLPRAFAEGDLPHEVRRVEVTLGVQLDGHGGGEWVFELREGELAVESGSRAEADFTVVQSVEDWRGALWEGRGGAIGKQAASLFRPGPRPAVGALGAAPSPAALGRLQGLDGLIRMIVSGGEGGDWQVGFKLGPGPIPEDATTTVTISAADADALERGELNPLEAFMAGRIQIAGDLALMMQMQAIQMQAAAEVAAAGDETDS